MYSNTAESFSKEVRIEALHMNRYAVVFSDLCTLYEGGELFSANETVGKIKRIAHYSRSVQYAILCVVLRDSKVDASNDGFKRVGLRWKYCSRNNA